MELRKRSVFLSIFAFTAVFAALALAQDALTSATQKIDFRLLRLKMVDTQMKNRGIKDSRVLEAISKVERQRFVPAALQHLAYEDYPLAIGSGQTISQPYIVALMTELLKLKGGERVLEIGTGSGYQAAILAELSREVYTVEILPELAGKAEALLKELGYTNIKVRCGDGYLGWQEFAPFDCIIVTCAPPTIPEALIEQLAEGGRMVVPVGEASQELKLLEKVAGSLKIRNVIPVRFVPMVKKGS